MSLSGTFFWEITTAQLFPRIPTEAIFGAVMALNAYSEVPVSLELVFITAFLMTYRLDIAAPGLKRP